MPTAVAHEILRQGKQKWASPATRRRTISRSSARVRLAKVDVAYIVGLEARGLSPHARRSWSAGRSNVTEWTNYALAVRFKAAAMGVPFLPVATMLGTDTFRTARQGHRLPLHRREAARPARLCTRTWRPFTCTRPTASATAASAAHRRRPRPGPCRPSTSSSPANGSSRTTRSAETPRTVIPFFCVDAVCEVPYGSYPGNMPYEYFSDEEHIREWLKVERTPRSSRSSSTRTSTPPRITMTTSSAMVGCTR